MRWCGSLSMRPLRQLDTIATKLSCRIKDAWELHGHLSHETSRDEPSDKRLDVLLREEMLSGDMHVSLKPPQDRPPGPESRRIPRRGGAGRRRFAQDGPHNASRLTLGRAAIAVRNFVIHTPEGWVGNTTSNPNSTSWALRICLQGPGAAAAPHAARHGDS